MKRNSIAVIFSIFFFAVTAFAISKLPWQEEGRSTQDVSDQLKLLSARLNLSQDQQAKLKVIIEDQLARLQAIGTDRSLSTNDKRDKVNDLRETTALKVRDQLNDDQKRKFDELRNDKNERMKERRERGEDCSMIW